jgi:hypothetical protein
MNPLRRLLLGAGRLPDPLRAGLDADGIVLLDEGLAGSVTYRHYRAPGRRSSYRKEAVSGAIAVSNRRLVVWAGRTKHIDLPRVGGFLATIDISVEQPDRVRFGYDAGRYNPDRSGTVEVRLRTARAAQVVELLGSAG